MSGIPPVVRRTPLTEPTVTDAAIEIQPPPPEAPPAASPLAMSRTEAEHTVTTLNRILNPLDLNVQIDYDEENRRYGFKIVDRRTNEVIREFPTPSVLEAARDVVAGLLVDQRG
jgi:uncharacterized FlaG/YvyC family protein